MMMEIQIKSYPMEAKRLVEIWENAGSFKFDIGYLTFKNKRPKNPKTQNRRIAGLKAESISYLHNDEELIKMSVENFIYLMVNCGVDIEIKEVSDEARGDAARHI